MGRYDRQTMLTEIGANGQEALRRSHVLVVGAGGLGSPVCLYLAGAGIGHISLVDADVVSKSNLQRQVLYVESQIGLPKTIMAACRLRSLNEETDVRVHNEEFDSQNAYSLVKDVDIVVDCCDNYTTRFLIDDVCTELKKPWVHGSIGEFYGQVAVLNYRRGKHFSDLYSEREELCSLPRKAGGVIGPVPGVIGSMQACETIRLLSSGDCALDGKLFSINLKTMVTNIIDI